MRASASLFGLMLLVTAAPSWASAEGNTSGGDPATGRAFALQACTPCHVVSADQLSPKRFANAPAFQAIANTRAMTGSALRAFLSTSHPTMPNLILSGKEMDDVVAYILSLRDRS